MSRDTIVSTDGKRTLNFGIDHVLGAWFDILDEGNEQEIVAWSEALGWSGDKEAIVCLSDEVGIERFDVGSLQLLLLAELGKAEEEKWLDADDLWF